MLFPAAPKRMEALTMKCNKCQDEVVTMLDHGTGERSKLPKGWQWQGALRQAVKCGTRNLVSTLCYRAGIKLANLNHLTPTETKEFFENARGMMGKKLQEFCNKYYEQEKVIIEEKRASGDYLPLGVYEKRGWDGAAIVANCKDWCDDPAWGRCYKVTVIGSTSLERDVERERQSLQSTGAAPKAKAKASSTGGGAGKGKVKMPSRASDPSTWVEGQHKLFREYYAETIKAKVDSLRGEDTTAMPPAVQQTHEELIAQGFALVEPLEPTASGPEAAFIERESLK